MKKYKELYRTIRAVAKYLSYVFTHKYYVWRECYQLGLYWQGLTHDLSKFSLTEIRAYSYLFKNFDRPVMLSYDFLKKTIPAMRYRKILKARWHHIQKNPHHWQRWILIQDDGSIYNVGMPKKYALEMICDWRAKSKQKREKNTSVWYNKHKKNLVLTPETISLIKDLL
ncbi:MAG: DUF5662 family protein [Planctomycetota bacterium]|nr:DUF5662 family protein [Planctomycetota bacterium]